MRKISNLVDLRNNVGAGKDEKIVVALELGRMVLESFLYNTQNMLGIVEKSGLC